ncbi:hypothetical protein HY745_07280 [Candidatus Desantisbacteria bacterium]|nr:hypothetical protein [Candidatus Desantisbacteria bacterium]
MILGDLVKTIEIKAVRGDPNVKFTSVAHDSRQVLPGGIFVAVKGDTSDGNDYIENAIKKGTGTNGKTTTSYILESILNVAGKKSGIIGTIYNKIGEEKFSPKYTTPDPVEFQSLLTKMVENKVEYVVAEVSSHALAQKRVWGSQFKIAIFTNLTHDHLDYHKTMEEYGKAKQELFCHYLESDGIAVINKDDPFSDNLVKCGKKIITYGFSRGSDIVAFNVSICADGTSLSLITPKGAIDCKVKLIGMFNVYNIMAAVGWKRQNFFPSAG